MSLEQASQTNKKNLIIDYILFGHPILSLVNEQVLHFLLNSKTPIIHLLKDDQIFEENENGKFGYFIVYGSVRISKDRSQMVIDQRGTIGENVIVNNESLYTYTSTCHENTGLILITKQWLELEFPK